VEYFFSTHNIPQGYQPDQTVRAAARGGHSEIIIYLHKYHGHPLKSALLEAAMTGQIFVLSELNMMLSDSDATATEWETANILDAAAASGHLDCVSYLHTWRPEGCTTRAMDSAAENGHLDVVHFLHENRHEGCSTLAMDAAARNGHLDVVKFLHENRHEGCTSDAVDWAARNGHMEVVKYLKEVRGETGTALAKSWAVYYRKGDIAEYLKRGTRRKCSVNLKIIT
jgi:hypothetical protein